MSNKDYEKHDEITNGSETISDKTDEKPSELAGVKNTDQVLSNKEFKKEIKLLQKALKLKLKEVSYSSNKDFKRTASKKQEALRKLPTEISSKAAEDFKKEWDAIENRDLEKSVEKMDSVIGAYNEQLRDVYKKAGRGEPEPITMDVSITSKTVSSLNNSKKDDITAVLGYLMFFLVTPLGMVIFEDYPAAGLLLLLGGFGSMPAVTNYIVKKVEWIYPANLFFIAQAFIGSGLFKLIMSVEA